MPAASAKQLRISGYAVKSFYEKNSNLSDSPLFREIVSLPIRPYPEGRIESDSGQLTFACCHGSFPEAEAVNETYRGKRIEELDPVALVDFQDTPFLDDPEIAYFWPLILMVIYLDPNSRFAYSMYSLVFNTWPRDIVENRHDSLEFLNEHELELSFKVLLYARDNLVCPENASQRRRAAYLEAMRELNKVIDARDIIYRYKGI